MMDTLRVHSLSSKYGFSFVFLSVRLPVCMSFCLSVCLSHSVCLSLFVYLCLSLCLAISNCLSLFVFLNLSFSICLSQFIFLNLSFSICLSQFVFLNLSLFFCLSLFAFLSLCLCVSVTHSFVFVSVTNMSSWQSSTFQFPSKTWRHFPLIRANQEEPCSGWSPTSCLLSTSSCLCKYYIRLGKGMLGKVWTMSLYEVLPHAYCLQAHAYVSIKLG
jgi:hypothetical protein